MLAALTILLGLAAAGTRLTGVLQPDVFRRMVRAMLGSAVWLRALGAAELIFGAALFAVLPTAAVPYTFIMYILAALLVVAGLVTSWGPSGLTRLMLRWVELWSDVTLRILCGVGVAVGLGLVALGLFVYR
jgi:uncharacterized protein YjeT (DUF2065 family)